MQDVVPDFSAPWKWTETKVSDYLNHLLVLHAKQKYSLTLANFRLSSQQLVPNYILYPCKCLVGFWPNFDQIKISPRPAAIFFFSIVNSQTWQNSPEGGYDEKSWEMACNMLMVTSSGDDIWPSGSAGLLTDKSKKINWRQTMDRLAYGCAVNNDQLAKDYYQAKDYCQAI